MTRSPVAGSTHGPSRTGAEAAGDAGAPASPEAEPPDTGPGGGPSAFVADGDVQAISGRESARRRAGRMRDSDQSDASVFSGEFRDREL
jgi:hypothetical protein